MKSLEKPDLTSPQAVAAEVLVLGAVAWWWHKRHLGDVPLDDYDEQGARYVRPDGRGGYSVGGIEDNQENIKISGDVSLDGQGEGTLLSEPELVGDAGRLAALKYRLEALIEVAKSHTKDGSS